MNSSSKIPESHEMNFADYIDALHSHGWEESFRHPARRKSAFDEARGAEFRRLDSELTDDVNRTPPPSRSAAPFPKSHE